MGVTLVEGGAEERLHVVIAGGGVAALEALLALAELAPGRISVELIAPEDEFLYRPLTVAEPFGLGEARRLGLAEICEAWGAEHRRAAVSEIVPAERVVRTSDGEEIEYGALLVAIGAYPVEALAGALTYRGQDDNPEMARLVAEIEAGNARRVAFAVPASVRWALPLYELALLTAATLRGARSKPELTVVTHESHPLDLFGRRASDSVRGLLAGEGIGLITGTAPALAKPGRLLLADGSEREADRVVTLPELRVPDLHGLPQGPRGFIPTDPQMRIEGVPSAWAAGDATWFPVKQGGLAAQQADVAAASIAALAGAGKAPVPFRPVLRGALLTGSVPHFMRSPFAGDEGSTSDGGALWWPPGKIAARYLAPFLAARFEGRQPTAALSDLEPPAREGAQMDEADRGEAIELALSAAEADARLRDYDGALHWLEIAEQLNMVLPREYVDKRRRWSEAAGRLAAVGGSRKP